MRHLSSFCFADVPVGIYNKYTYISRYCAGYETDLTPKYYIEITPEALENEKNIAVSFASRADKLELSAFHRMLCDLIISDDVLLFHSSATMVDGKAYLFAAPSGTGKSTHTRIWRDLFGDKVIMINDDKPFVKLNGELFTVYGSPWNGKHHLSNNISAPLAGICFLSQGKENFIRPLSNSEKIPYLLKQTYRPESEGGTKNMIRLLIEMSEKVPMWHLDCTISKEAAELSFSTMTGEILHS